jgi:rhodanese-related sulfurtransferase
MSEEEDEGIEPLNLPEISPPELAEWMQARPELVLLDVREPYEFSRVKIQDERVAYAPMSELARKYLDALPQPAREKDATLVIFCHHGIRSAQVTAWLMDQGWQSVYNLAGGIEAYARQVDPQIGFY